MQMKNKFNLYLGDIDPNNYILDVMSVRRRILFDLLLWDSIVLSDSQFLTDPRIQLMMSGFDGKSVDYDISNGLIDSHKDFELLLANNLVEVATRNNGSKSSVQDLWKQMHNASANAPVPYLPKNNKYAHYLDSINFSKKPYEIKNLAGKFRERILDGIEKGAILLDADNRTDAQLSEFISADTILFRDIKKVLDDAFEGERISAMRKLELYRFFYSCYSSGVPYELGCFTSTSIYNVPLHLSFGCDTNEPAHVVDEKMRKTWALDPRVIDMLSTEAFLDVRESVEECIKNQSVLKYRTGQLTDEEIPLFYDVWEEYTARLETELKKALINERRAIDDIMSKRFIPTQEQVIKGGAGLVINTTKKVVESAVPGIGMVFEIIDLANDIRSFTNSVVLLGNRKQEGITLNFRNEIADYLDGLVLGSNKVITKYR